MNWQPIESLHKQNPKLHECFIGLFDGGKVYPFFYDSNGPLGVHHTKKNKQNPLFSIMTGWAVYPTHWMPLPEPPKENE